MYPVFYLSRRASSSFTFLRFLATMAPPYLLFLGLLPQSLFFCQAFGLSTFLRELGLGRLLCCLVCSPLFFCSFGRRFLFREPFLLRGLFLFAAAVETWTQREVSML